MNDKFGLELLGKKVVVAVDYNMFNDSDQINVCVSTRNHSLVDKLEVLLLQMASSHSFVQSRFPPVSAYEGVITDDITPSLWESLP